MHRDMSTHGWEDDDNFVAYGFLRDSTEGRKIVEERRRRWDCEKQEEKDLQENPHKRMAKLTGEMDDKKRRKTECELLLLRLNSDIKELRRQIMDTGDEMQKALDKQRADLAKMTDV